MSCGRGQIQRAGYFRKAYTRTDGTRVASTYVQPSCIKDRGNKGKGPKLFTLKKGVLGQYGYEDIKNMTADARHKALGRAVRANNGLEIFQRVNALAILNKNTNPSMATLARRDANWIKKEFYDSRYWS